MNERDSETVAGVLRNMGYEPAGGPAQADFIALNTCAVRAKPQHKVFSKLGELRRLKQRHPDKIIAVLGCVAQIAANELLQRAPYVDIVMGPRNYSQLAEAIAIAQQACDSSSPVVITDTSETIPEYLPVARESGVSAFVNVTYGCNNFCAYCVVPYARGREQSRAVADVLAEVRQAVAQGYKQITLLGQNVNSYGIGLSNGCDFADLLAEVSQVDGLQRIRFTTSHPKDISPKLLDAIAELPEVCEHLHLPIQSGDNEVLAQMGRGYTYAEYYSLIEAARQRIAGLSITTDVMVGFPGENQEQFHNTLQAFEQIRFDQAFMFKYNDRPGTRAAEMPNKVPEEVKQARLEQLIELQNKTAHQINQQQLGQAFEVLVGGRDPKAAGKVRGHTRTNKLVIFAGNEDLIGKLAAVQTQQVFLWGFLGRVATNKQGRPNDIT